MAIGDEGKPHGVSKGGMRASGVNGGWGREERPVPPIMAMGTGSTVFWSMFVGKRRGEIFACVCGWEILHLGDIF